MTRTACWETKEKYFWSVRDMQDPPERVQHDLPLHVEDHQFMLKISLSALSDLTWPCSSTLHCLVTWYISLSHCIQLFYVTDHIPETHWPTLTTCWYSLSSDTSLMMNLHSSWVFLAALGLMKCSSSWQAARDAPAPSTLPLLRTQSYDTVQQ